MPPRPKNLKGQKFGTLLVLDYVMVVEGGRSRGKWRCLCDCGSKTQALGVRLVSGRTVSCGCRRAAGVNLSHGMSYTAEHGVWRRMKTRCYSPNDKRFNRYGGRGITVCSEWLESFEVFFEDMGERPSSKYSLERVDNDKGYLKTNCKWATSQEQGNNRTTSRLVEYKGVTKTVAQWAAICEMQYMTLYRRLFAHNWSVERALLENLREVTIKLKEETNHAFTGL